MRQTLTKLASSAVLAAALVPSISAQEPANVRVDSYRWGLLGAGKTTVYTQTQPGVVYTPRAVLYSDGCCTRPGIGLVPTQAEIVTGRCIENQIDWGKSVFALPGKAIREVGKGLTHLGEAVTPRGVYDKTRCNSRPYCAPVVSPCDPCATPSYNNGKSAIQQGDSVLKREYDQPQATMPADQPTPAVPAPKSSAPTVPLPPTPGESETPKIEGPTDLLPPTPSNPALKTGFNTKVANRGRY
ncbi:MAG: hypothetical protein PHF67_01730 [Candidatus Nanoarchaeia archaeon]|nr:hypothetical protein [Candidatus Nanoarchaeia archaeon]